MLRNAGAASARRMLYHPAIMQTELAPRPKVGRPRIHKDDAARQQAYRDRHYHATVRLDDGLNELLENFIKNSGKQLSKAKAIELLLRDELAQTRAAETPQK